MAEGDENKDEQSTDSELDNMLDGLISGDDAAESEETSETADEPELDNMLDGLISGDDAAESEETLNDSKEKKEDKSTESNEESDDEDLDRLLDDILNDDDEDAEIAEEEISAPTEAEEKTEEIFEDGEENEENEQDDEESEQDDEESEQDDEESEQDDEDDKENAATAELETSENDYPDEDEESSEERIKIGPISVPATRTGKMMLAGGVLGILLTASGVYFAMQTFAPPELAEVEKPESEIPEGLTPKKGEEAITAPKEEPAAAPEAKTEDIKSEVAQELNKSGTLSETTKEVGVPEEDSAGLQAALSPESKIVKLATIMPVAFDVNDIRVLSFTLEITFENEAGAKVLSSALPLFEEITMLTVEKFLKRKFYNDIIYVKEKLQKRLKIAFNKKIEGDTRVKKIKFQDFLIQ